MFGYKEKKPLTLSLNSLVQETLVEGDIESATDIRIDGTLRGNLTCSAKVVLGETGYICGDVVCKDAVVAGKLDGNLKVNERLDLLETGKVQGDIISRRLVIADGASFNGHCRMGEAPPRKEPTAPPHGKK